MRRRPDLPNLPSVRAFEAAGRLRSFHAAGDELSITQSAVSHHVRRLEGELGVPLFVREARGVRLTAAGSQYFETVSRVIAELSQATVTARRASHAGRSSLRLSVLPSFGRYWLVPRLETWRAAHPEIELEIDPSLTLADLTLGEVDLAIRYGRGRWAGAKAALLVNERLSPVVSPALFATLPSLPSFDDIQDIPRIVNSSRADWEEWRHGSGSARWAGGDVRLTEYGLVIDSVLAGHGVALGRLWLLRDHLKSGQLVQPIDEAARPGDLGYWLLRDAANSNPAARIFEDWISAVMRACAGD